MTLIEINPEDKERVFEILINNGLFRALSESRFDIVEDDSEVFEKFKKEGIKIKIIDND